VVTVLRPVCTLTGSGEPSVPMSDVGPTSQRHTEHMLMTTALDKLTLTNKIIRLTNRCTHINQIFHHRHYAAPTAIRKSLPRQMRHSAHRTIGVGGHFSV